MLKFLENRDEALDLVHSLSEQAQLKSFKLGVAGSYVTALNKKSSPIDIVLKLRDGENKDLIGDLDICAFIHNTVAQSYSNKIQIIWLDLLETDEEALLKFIGFEGIENNPESAYTNIVGDVRWVDEDEDTDMDDEDEDYDEDENARISSSVVTFDETEEDE